MDQANKTDMMDGEASFIVGIIILPPTPPKIIALLFKQSVTMASPLLQSSLSSPLLAGALLVGASWTRPFHIFPSLRCF